MTGKDPIIEYLRQANQVSGFRATYDDFLGEIDAVDDDMIAARNIVFAWRYMAKRTSLPITTHDILVLHNRLGIGLKREEGFKDHKGLGKAERIIAKINDNSFDQTRIIPELERKLPFKSGKRRVARLVWLWWAKRNDRNIRMFHSLG